MRVFGYAWKINFPKMLFNWPCVLVGLTRKWFEVKIFTSNHFRTHAQREREIAPRPRHEPRAQSLSTSYPSTSPMNPEPRAIRLHTLRLRHLTSTSNRTQIAPFDFAGEPRAQITHSTSSRLHSRIAPRRHQSHRSQLRNGWVLMNLTRFDEFFLVGFCFCVYLLKNGIIYLFGSWKNVRKCEEQEENVFSILFSATQPNTRKYFPKHFLECNQTLENIFLSRK